MVWVQNHTQFNQFPIFNPTNQPHLPGNVLETTNHNLSTNVHTYRFALRPLNLHGTDTLVN